MNIGSLRKRITLQSPVRTVNAIGASTVTWKDEFTVWAAIWSTIGSEAVRSGQLNLETTHRIRLRYRSGIKASWRGFDGDKYYYIVAIIDPDMAHKQIDLL